MTRLLEYLASAQGNLEAIANYLEDETGSASLADAVRKGCVPNAGNWPSCLVCLAPKGLNLGPLSAVRPAKAM